MDEDDLIRLETGLRALIVERGFTGLLAESIPPGGDGTILSTRTRVLHLVENLRAATVAQYDLTRVTLNSRIIREYGISSLSFIDDLDNREFGLRKAFGGAMDMEQIADEGPAAERLRMSLDRIILEVVVGGR